MEQVQLQAKSVFIQVRPLTTPLPVLGVLLEDWLHQATQNGVERQERLQDLGMVQMGLSLYSTSIFHFRLSCQSA